MKHLFSRSLILCASTLVSLFIATQSAWGADAVVWQFSSVTKGDLTAGTTYSYNDMSNQKTMEYIAGSSCSIDDLTSNNITNRCIKMGGGTKDGTRVFILNITGTGTLSIETNGKNIGSWTGQETSSEGAKLFEKYSGYDGTSATPSPTVTAEINVASRLYLTTSSKAYVSKITWTPSSSPSSPSTYTVTYDLNGGSGTAPTQESLCEGGTFKVASADDITKTCYTFAGWSDGSKTYAAGDTYTMGTANVTLKAQWTALSVYTVTFNYNYEGATASNSETGCSEAPVTLPSPTRTGYTFKGWYDAATGGNLIAEASATEYTPTASITLYAQWEEIVEPTCTTDVYYNTVPDGKTQSTRFTFSSQPSGTNTLANTMTIDGVDYTCANRSSSTTSTFSFTIPDGKEATLYMCVCGGGSSRVMQAVCGTEKRSVSISDDKNSDNTTYKTFTLSNLTAGNWTVTCIEEDGKTAAKSWYLAMLGLQECKTCNSAGLSFPEEEYTVELGSSFTAPTLTKTTTATATYESSNTAVATVDAEGAITLVGKGTTTITASTPADGDYCAGEASYQLTVTLPACETPNITTPPADGDYCAGETITPLSVVVASVSDGTLLYQWKKDGEVIKDATNATYTPTEKGTYTCVVTNTLDGHTSASITSDAAVITINAATDITTQPTVQTVVQGNPATLTVVASGSGTLTYQWYTCQSDGSNPQPISSATEATYAVTPDASGTIYYRVIVTGKCGKDTSDVVSITATDGPCFSMQVIAVSDKISGQTTLTASHATITGGEVLYDREAKESLAFTSDGIKFNSNSDYLKVTLTEGIVLAQGSQIKVSYNIGSDDNGIKILKADKKTEICSFSNQQGTYTETFPINSSMSENVFYITRVKGTAYLKSIEISGCGAVCLDSKPTLTAADNTTLCGTGNVVFTATDFTAGATLNLYQVGNATPLRTVDTNDETSVTFTAVEVNTTTKYYVVATKDCDKSSDTVTVTVNTLPTTASLVNSVGSIINVGDSRTFEVTTDGKGCTYQWLRDGVAISGATGKTYEFTAEMSDVNTYSNFSCRVTGCDGTTQVVTTPEVDVTIKLDNCYYITEDKTLSATTGYDFGDFVLYIANKDNKYGTSTSNICAPATKRYYASSVVIELKTVGVSAIRLFGQHTANRSVSKVEVSDALNGTYTEVPTSEYTKVDYTYSSGTPCGELGISGKNFLAGDFVRLTFGGEEFRISGLCVTGLNCSTPDLSYPFTEVEVAWAQRENTNLLPIIVNANSVPVTYSSTNEKVATVDANTGVVKLIGVGTANIIASFEGDGEYCPKNAVYSVAVTCPDDVPQIAVDGTVDLANCNDAILLKLQDSHGVDILSGNIQWYRNGVLLPDATAPTYTATVAGTYTATLTNTCELLTSNSAVVTSSVPQPIVTPVIPKRFFQISNRSVRPYEATTHYPLFEVTPKATAEYKGEKKWKSSYTIHHAGTVTAGKATIDWVREDASTATTISIGADYKALGKWLTDNHSSAVVGDTLMLTMKTINSCDELDNATADSIPIILTDKYSLAYIVRGKTIKNSDNKYTIYRDFYKDVDTENLKDNLYIKLCEQYNVTPVNAYATYSYANYEPFDLLLLTDYPNATGGEKQATYIDSLADLVDKKPILSLKAHMSALPKWSEKGFTSNPIVPGDGSEGQAQKTLTVLCFSHDMFTGAKWDDEALRTLTILSNVYDDGGTYKGIQGFTALNTSEFMNIATVDDAKGSRKIVACCERQKEVDARFIMLSINRGATQYINDQGADAIDKLLEYLLETDASQLSDCSITFDNGAEADGGSRKVTVGGTDYTSGNEQWNNPANWNFGKIPTQLQNVRIEANCIVSGNTYGAGNVRIHDKYTLTIAPNGGLASVGKFGVYSDNNWNQPQPITDTKYITVQANAEKTGMLMHSHTDQLAATVEMYSPARYDGTLANGKPKRVWSYVAIPVEEGTVPDIFNGAYTYLWQETTTGWIRYRDGSTFQEFNAIALSQPKPMVFTFAGNLALAKKYEFTLTNTKGSTMKGMNLIGNSWTAPIQITKLKTSDFGTGLEASVYIYSTGRDPESGPTTTATEGALEAGYWTAIPIETAKGTGWKGPKIIPAMQAFEVNFATNATTTSATLTLDYNTIVRASGVDYSTLNQKLYAPGRNSTAEILQPDPSAPAPYEPTMLRIRVADTAACYNLHLLQGERFSEGFDNGWDGFYTGTDGRAPGLCALTTAGEMQVSAQPEIDNTALVFTPGRSDTYTFSFSLTETEDEPLAQPLYLNDMQLRKSCLIDDSRTYTFQSSENDMENRFVISHIAFEEQETPTGIANLATVDQQLMLSNPAREALTIRVYDPAGRLCSEMSTREAMLQITLPEPQGVYMIHITGEHTEILRKIVQ